MKVASKELKTQFKEINIDEVEVSKARVVFLCGQFLGRGQSKRATRRAGQSKRGHSLACYSRAFAFEWFQFKRTTC